MWVVSHSILIRIYINLFFIQNLFIFTVHDTSGTCKNSLGMLSNTDYCNFKDYMYLKYSVL